MAATIISLVLLIALILIAVRMISVKRTPGEEIPEGNDAPLIHASGIYSIVRKSPREDLLRIRPSEEDLRKYLSAQDEDMNGHRLSDKDREKLFESWRNRQEESIAIIEKGDADEVEFYYFDYPESKECPVCKHHLRQGKFVSRQEIYRYPGLIPPFHPGCTMMLLPYQGKENLRETTILGMTPLFESDRLPALPEWTQTIRQF